MSPLQTGRLGSMGPPDVPPAAMSRKRRLPFFIWLYLGFSFFIFTVTGMDSILGVSRSPQPWYYMVMFLGVLAFQFIMVVVETATRNLSKYFCALVFHGFGVLACVALSMGALRLQYASCAVLVMGICLYNSFPVSAVLLVVSTAACVASSACALHANGANACEIIFSEFELGALMGLVSLFASFSVHYRERVIDFSKENGRLDSLVDRLTKANLRYQEYARTIEESSTENERKRITREIHDIIGYTMVNNITMMEVTMDMMHENPLGAAYIVQTARENAQTGLTRIREALYDLRTHATESPKGFDAVSRLIRVFEQGTGVKVLINLTSVTWDFPPELDSVFYHIIQECLINSFRHGRATQIRIFCVGRRDEIMLKISDNGEGAGSFDEGIGITGMRERISKVNGSLTVESSADGFHVMAVVPARRQGAE